MRQVPAGRWTSRSSGGMLPGASFSASTTASARNVLVKSAPSAFIAVKIATWRVRKAHTQLAQTEQSSSKEDGKLHGIERHLRGMHSVFIAGA